MKNAWTWQLALIVACMTAACRGEAPPPPEPTLSVIGEPELIGTSGWLLLRTPRVAESVFTRDEDEDAWLESFEPVDSAPMTWTMTGPADQVVPLEPVRWRELVEPARTHLFEPANGAILTPGAWTAEGWFDDQSLGSAEVIITEHGQVQDFAVDAVDDLIYRLPDGPGELSNIGDLLNLWGLIVRVDRQAETTHVTVWSELGCRVWTGPVDLDAQGRMDLREGEWEGDLQLLGLTMRAGLSKDLQTMEGFRFATELDARDLDAALTPLDEEIVQGRACESLDGATPCLQCADRRGEECVSVHNLGASGERISEVEALAGLEDSEGRPVAAQSLDELPSCGVPAPGSLAVDLSLCSTVGSVGMGAWLFGVGALLWRRRRKA